MEIDIKAPLEVVLESIVNYDYLRYSIKTDRKHSADNDYDYHFDLQNYDPLPKIKPSRQNDALESLAEPILSNTRDWHASACTTVSSDLEISPKNPATLLSEGRRWRQQPHMVEFVGSVMMRDFFIKKTKVYKLCMNWEASVHPSNPKEWTEITLSFQVTHSFDERMRQILYRRREEAQATTISDSLIKRHQENHLLQDVIVKLVLQRQMHPLLLIKDAILHWVKQSSESSNGATVKREIAESIQQNQSVPGEKAADTSTQTHEAVLEFNRSAKKEDTASQKENNQQPLSDDSTSGETILSGSVIHSGQEAVSNHDDLTPLFETMETIKITLEERLYLLSTFGALVLCNVYLCCRPRKRYACA